MPICFALFHSVLLWPPPSCLLLLVPFLSPNSTPFTKGFCLCKCVRLRACMCSFHVIFFSVFWFCFVLFDSNYDDNDNDYACLYISEERRGMNLSGSESREDLGGSVEGKTIIGTDCVKINFAV